MNHRDRIRKALLGVLVVGLTWAGQAHSQVVQARVFVVPPTADGGTAVAGGSPGQAILRP